MKKVIVSNNFNDIELVGGKAYNLNILKESNINVPNFFVISSKMYELYLDEKLDLNYVENCINEYCNNNFKKETLFAIRSSANVEDSNNMSYAGQFKSYLNVGQEEIFKHIQKCWDFASKKCNIKMAVIVQQMIKSEISGIGFTANPEGILNEAVITAGRGLGNNIVEDKIATITYYYNLNDDIYYFEKQEDSIELLKTDIEKIIDSLKQIKKIYKKHMDIEWAISDSELYILQARPITTLGEKEIIVLDNSNIIESYPNISSPLTQTSAKILYSLTFTEIFRKLLGDKEIEKYLDIFNDVLESVNGRIYYRISNWYTFFQFLPFSNKIIKIWQEMLGVMDKKVIYNEKKIGIGLKLKLLIRAIVLLKRNNSTMSSIEKEYDRIQKAHNEKMLLKDKYSNLELLKINNDIASDTTKLAALALVNDMYAFICTGFVKSLSKNKKYQKEVNDYISNICNLESMKPINMLNEISKNIRMDKEVYSEFANISTNNEFFKFIEKHKNNSNIKDIRNYINMYGDRVLEELKIETKTYRTDPLLLVEKIKNNNIETAVKDEKIDIFKIKCNFILKWFIKNAIKGISQREMTRINRAKSFGMARETIMQIAENFENSGVIDNKEDIFYIGYDELGNYINNESINLKEIIKRRKQEYKEFENIPNYSRIVFAGKIFNKRIYSNTMTNYEASNLLVGTPVSTGMVTGECLIIDDIKNIGDVKNKILVTKTTDPGWAFLLKDAVGLISERGSLLSHTAIISRELGIPAVVNIKNATNILKNGDKIRLDANKGEIEVLRKDL